MMKQIDKDTLTELIQTMTHKQMAFHLKVSVVTLRKFLRIYNIKSPPKDKEGKALNLKHIETLHESGYTIYKICEIVNASFDTVSNFLNPNLAPVSKNLLHFYFVKEKLSIPQIANRTGSTYPTIKKYLLLYDLLKPDIQISEESLLEHYSKTIPEIAKVFNTNTETINYFLKKYNLMKKGKVEKEELEHLYCTERKTPQEISEILGVSYITIWRRIKQYKLTRDFNPDLDLFQIQFNENRDLGIEDLKQKLADFYNVSLSEISIFLIKHNMIKKKKRGKVTFTKEQLGYLYQKKGIEGLTKILNMTDYNVKRALKRNGIIPYAKPKKRIELVIPKEKIKFLYHEKYAHYSADYAKEEVAKELNISVYAIRKYIKTYNLNRPKF